MIDRFTEKAREAIQAAAELAAQLEQNICFSALSEKGRVSLP